MPTFQYSALDAAGKRHKGFVEADSKARAFVSLRDKGLTPISLSSASAARQDRPLSRLSALLPASRIRIGEAFFYLSMLLQSGSALAESLDLLGRMGDKRSGRIWLDIRDKVESGQTFSSALAGYRRHFPGMYVGMVQVAEQTGRLGPILEKVAEYEEHRTEVAGRVVTAFAYPAMIVLFGAGAVYYLLTNVLPKITKIFEGSGAQLPPLTKILLGVSTVLQGMGPLALLLPVALALLASWAYRRRPVFRERVDALLWRIPLIKKSALARFSGMLGTQLEAGIPLVQALDNAAGATNSQYLKAIIAKARAEVSAGRPLDRVLMASGAFPDIYIQTLSTGQKAGKLGMFLGRITRIMEKETDNSAKRILALMEPLLILCIGVAVMFVVLAILVPIFDMTRLVR